MRILLTNDDGIEAPGLFALYQAVRDMGEVHVVAPAKVQSAMSHAVTFHRGLRTESRVVRNGHEQVMPGTAVAGSPADCVKLGVRYLVPGPIDLVLSGMNSGANIGVNVYYSGTVAAAAEGAILGLPAIAVSLHIGDLAQTRWDDAAAHARRVIEQLHREHLQPGVVMNVNVPILDDGRPPQGIRVLPISTSPLADEYDATAHADGTTEYHASAGLRFREEQPDTDVAALFQRFVTVTPLRFDVSCRTTIEQLSQALHADSDI